MALHKKLAHLTPGQVDDLVKRYNAGENLASLVKAFNIDARPRGLVHLLPPVVHKDIFCFYCPDTNLISKQPARTFTPHRPVPPHCPECGHRTGDCCRCKPCWEKEQAERRLSEKKKRDLIDAICTRQVDVPSPGDLTLRDAVFLLALARHAVTDDLGYLKPYYDFANTLAPLYVCRCDILLHLYGRGLIAISPGNDIRAFAFDPAVTEMTPLAPDRVLWRFLPGLEEAGKRRYLRRLETLAGAGDWPAGWSGDVAGLWHDIVKHECLAYFVSLLEARECDPYPLDDKAYALFYRLLADFPPSGIFNLCRQGVTKTMDYFAGHNTHYMDRSIYVFIGAIQKIADEAKARGWELPHYGQHCHCPQTDVSATFFNDFLRLGDTAFEVIPPRPAGRWSGPVNAQPHRADHTEISRPMIPSGPIQARGGEPAVRNDTDPTLEDERRQVQEIVQQVEALVKLIQRNGHQVASFLIELEAGPQQRFDLHPEEDPTAVAAAIAALSRDGETRH